jgi:hypothetical protein
MYMWQIYQGDTDKAYVCRHVLAVVSDGYGIKTNRFGLD